MQTIQQHFISENGIFLNWYVASNATNCFFDIIYTTTLN